ncbi:MAG: glycosyltransferase family 2 protein [Planctomycetota bacterium]
MPPATDTAIRPVIVVPTYQNGSTVCTIARAVLDAGWACIVVDDGSTDGTDQTLAQLRADDPDASLHLEKHPANRGKAAALMTGFDRARALGYSHAITLDADGQHDPQQIGLLWDAAVRYPGDLILGERPAKAEGGTPWRSTVGRRVSNRLISLQSGVRVSDSQTGFRVYPLAVVEKLDCVFSRFAFETEVLIRAGRAGVGVTTVPIDSHYSPRAQRISHFKPLRDSLHSLAMHAAVLKDHPRPAVFLNKWLRHQLLYLPLSVFLIVGLVRMGLEPEPRWHPAFLVGGTLSLIVIALWRRLRLGYQPLPAASFMFLLLGSLGVLSQGTAFYPLIHNSYGQLQELALHLWVAAVCVMLAVFRPGWLLGVDRVPEASNRGDAWVIAGVSVLAVFMGILLRPTGAALTGMVPFVTVLFAQTTLHHRALALTRVDHRPATSPAGVA